MLSKRIIRNAAWIFVFSAASKASFGQIVVPGTSNVFGAGHAVAPAPGGNGAGTLPPSFALSGSACLRYIIVSGATGSVVATAGGGAIAPDGITSPVTNTNSVGGISGLSVSRGLPLTAVFCSNIEPADPSPTRLILGSNIGFTTFFTQTNQTFFVGDGLTGQGSGTSQRFVVPTGATRVFFGFQDGGNFAGNPGFYADNSGSVQIQVSEHNCPADFNCSGTISVIDVFHFLNAWFANDPRTDFNGVNGIGVQDIFDFIADWFTGC